MLEPFAEPFGLCCPSIYTQSKDYTVEITRNDIHFFGVPATGGLIYSNAAFGSGANRVHLLDYPALVNIDYVGFLRYLR